jgi:hypothetical protein
MGQTTTHNGVGDDSCSWGVDGARCLRWHNGASGAWGEAWAEGDVLGFAADLDAHKLLFGRNGVWSVLFEGIELPLNEDGSAGVGIFPALSGSSRSQPLKVRANFGDRDWSYGPPDDSYGVFLPSAKAQLAAQLVRNNLHTRAHIMARAANTLHGAACALTPKLPAILLPVWFDRSTAAPVFCAPAICTIAAATHIQPLQSLGFALEGHPDANFNGAYRKVSEHKGWPVLRNGAGMFCYRYEPQDKWLLSNVNTPDKSACTSSIVSAEGPLPIGVQTWRCWVDGKWVKSSLSVTVLVRPFPSLCLSLYYVRFSFT